MNGCFIFLLSSYSLFSMVLWGRNQGPGERITCLLRVLLLCNSNKIWSDHRVYSTYTWPVKGCFLWSWKGYSMKWLYPSLLPATDTASVCCERAHCLHPLPSSFPVYSHFVPNFLSWSASRLRCGVCCVEIKQKFQHYHEKKKTFLRTFWFSTQVLVQSQTIYADLYTGMGKITPLKTAHWYFRIGFFFLNLIFMKKTLEVFH